MENGSNKLFRIEVLVLETTEEWEIFPNFELLPCFNIDVQPEMVNNNFKDEKESLISRRRNAIDNGQQFKSKNEIWVYGVAGSRRQGNMTSTDLRRTINAPTWTDFHLFLQKELTTNVYKTKLPTKRSSTESFISSIIPRDMYVHARPKKAGKWSDVRAQLQPITVTSERTGFRPVWKQRNEFQQIERFLCEWKKIKTL